MFCNYDTARKAKVTLPLSVEYPTTKSFKLIGGWLEEAEAAEKAYEEEEEDEVVDEIVVATAAQTASVATASVSEEPTLKTVHKVQMK